MTTNPRIWSSDTNYTNGPAVGTPTKVDPGATLAAEGFVPGRAGAQHLNHELNELSMILNRTVNLQKGVVLSLQELIPAGSRSLGSQVFVVPAAGAGFRFIIVAGDTNGVWEWHPSEQRIEIQGSAEIDIKGVDVDPNTGRIVAVADSANPVLYSDNEGATWTNVAAADAFGGGQVGRKIIWDDTNGTWIALATVANVFYTSADATASSWTTRGLGIGGSAVTQAMVHSPVTGQTVFGALVGGVVSTVYTNDAFLPIFLAVPGDSFNYTRLAWHPDGYFLMLVGKVGGWKLLRCSDPVVSPWVEVYEEAGVLSSPIELTVDPTSGLCFILGTTRLGVSYDVGVTWDFQYTSLTQIDAKSGRLFGIRQAAIYAGITQLSPI